MSEYQALTDIPVAPYYPQLDEIFPGSKFILTTRPTEAWLLSVEKLLPGSTTLSLSAYTADEKDRAQGALNFCVFATLALSSFASGV